MLYWGFSHLVLRGVKKKIAALTFTKRIKVQDWYSLTHIFNSNLLGLLTRFRERRPNSKKNMVYWTLSELTIITSPYVHFKVDSNTFTMGHPLPESTLTLCQSRLHPPSQRLFGFGLRGKGQLVRSYATLFRMLMGDPRPQPGVLGCH